MEGSGLLGASLVEALAAVAADRRAAEAVAPVAPGWGQGEGKVQNRERMDLAVVIARRRGSGDHCGSVAAEETPSPPPPALPLS